MTGIKEKKTECSSESHKSLKKCTQRFVRVALLFFLFEKMFYQRIRCQQQQVVCGMTGQIERPQAKHHRKANQRRETQKQSLSKERHKEWNGIGTEQQVAPSHIEALSNLCLFESVLTWKQGCLSVAMRKNIKEDDVSSGHSIRASWERFADEKYIERCSRVVIADNRLNNVNNTNHLHNGGLNNIWIKRTSSSI